ncbi:MAG TPA: hypothetical protein VJV23_12300 [Candidatus Polarisedimenticolia bacterium]|nr:hypothetical protein [Candidatus Polarisedimenticolia bacterium]
MPTIRDTLDRLLDVALHPVHPHARSHLASKAGGIVSALLNGWFEPQAARQAVWHPNGFLKLTLAQGARGQRLRLHIWPARIEVEPLTEDVHTHYWAFSSVVLLGSLWSETFTPSPSGKQYRDKSLRDFQRKAGGGRTYPFRIGGLVRLSKDGEQRLVRGGTHWLAAGGTHRISRHGAGPAATLVLQGPPLLESCHVYVPLDHEAQWRKDAPPPARATSTEVHQAVECLLRAAPLDPGHHGCRAPAAR